MRKIQGARCHVSELDRHHHICDLVFFDEPLVSLFKGYQSSWIYLWVDNDDSIADRWLVFPVDRTELVAYLDKQVSLRELLEQASKVIVLDKRIVRAVDGEPSIHRHAKYISNRESIEEYFPDEDSFFDETLTTDISLARDLAPKRFDIPVDGQWFITDLARFSSSYNRLYSFFYCTAPRFITNLPERISKYMNSPWQGGYSRLNLFDAMHRMIPSMHEMRVAKYSYASPGDIEIEALDSVGYSIKSAVLSYLTSEDRITLSIKTCDAALAGAKLKRNDVSLLDDTALLARYSNKHIGAIQAFCGNIGDMLNLRKETDLLVQASPNCVIAAKALLAFLKQLRHVAEFQRRGMLDLSRARQ